VSEVNVKEPRKVPSQVLIMDGL